MMRDRPSPDAIMEQLADRVALQTERGTPVAFSAALDELVRYHRFLLGLNSALDDEGAPYSFAEVDGGSIRAPHEMWAHQYSRLFDRAIDRVPIEGEYLAALAYVPSRLLVPEPGTQHSPAIGRSILNMMPSLMLAVQAWVTRRRGTKFGDGDLHALSGSDEKAYGSVMARVMGAWETLLDRVPELSQWSKREDTDPAAAWKAFTGSWPFLWRHLSNTAYCLAVAVWNGDALGARLYREALVRWPGNLFIGFDGYERLRFRRLLYPDVLGASWSEAERLVDPLSVGGRTTAAPNTIYRNVIGNVHDDVLQLTASLLLLWGYRSDRHSRLGPIIAGELLRKKRPDNDGAPYPSDGGPSFRSLALGTVRMHLAGDRFTRVHYGARLDDLLRELDQLSEPDRVPSRIFTPSTMNDRKALLTSDTAILAAFVPDEADGGFAEAMSRIAEVEEALPDGDASLRSALHEIERYKTASSQGLPIIKEMVAFLAPERDIDACLSRLGDAMDAARAAIANRRSIRLRERPIDDPTLQDLRRHAEQGLIATPAPILFFQDVEGGPADEIENGIVETAVIYHPLEKGRLTRPPMEDSILGFEDLVRDQSALAGAQAALDHFRKLPRMPIRVAATPDVPAFWMVIAPQIEAVGADPVLVISREMFLQLTETLGYVEEGSINGVTMSRGNPDRRRGHYYATIEGVEVFVTGLSDDRAILFSARLLRSVRYGKLADTDVFLTTSFKPDESGVAGDLSITFRQFVEIGEGPVFELIFVPPVEDVAPTPEEHGK